MSRTDLGVKGDVEAIAGLIDVRGLRLLDIGCGPGRTARELAGAGARVLGLEPDPAQAGENRKSPPVEGVELAEARAERLPVADATFDGALFFRSLHHVPIAAMERAIGEAKRAVKPGGFVAFVEPGMEGSHFAMMRPFHDETVVRNAAQEALDRFAAPLLGRRARYVYRQFPQYADFAALVARVTGQTFNDIPREKVETDEVRRLFEAGRQPSGEYRFEQPMYLDLFRLPAAV